MKAETTIFYDVDTQRDFMHPSGALSAPGAERILPRLAALTRLARQAGVRIVGSVDRHFPGDSELRSAGGPYPEHCMDGSPGQKKVDATAPEAPIWVENREYPAEELDRLLAGKGEVFIEKQRLDVFEGNRNARAVLDRLLRGMADVVVYGVVTEICVDLAIRRLREWPVRLHVPTDAIAALDAKGEAEALERWTQWGVELTSVAEIERRLRPGGS